MTTSLRLLAIALVILVVGTIIVFMLNRDKINDEVIMDDDQKNMVSQIPPVEEPKTDVQKEYGDKEFPEPNKPPYFYAPLGGDWIEINKNWSIRLEEVISDNRCPMGVVCETSGTAKVKVQFMQPDVDYSHAYFEELEVQGLNRYPTKDGEIKPELAKPLKINRIHGITNEDIGFTITLADLKPYPQKEFVTDLADKSYIGLFYIQD